MASQHQDGERGRLVSLPSRQAARRAAGATSRSCSGSSRSRFSPPSGRSPAGCRSASPSRPSPTRSIAFVGLIADGSLPKAYLSTLQPLVLGVVLSAFLGVGLGTLCGLWRTGEWLLIPVFIVLQAAPVAAFIPLVTFVYGIGMTAKTLAVMILALPVIVLNTYKAVRNVNASLLVMCRSFLGTRWQEVAKIILPDASPVIFAGLRLGVAAGFVGVVLAELLITPTGIGDLITYHRSRADYAEMYATIASIIALSTLTLVALAVGRDRVSSGPRREAA